MDADPGVDICTHMAQPRNYKDVKWLKDRSTTKIENFKEQRYTWFPWVHGLSRQVRKWNVRENPIGYDYFVSGNGRKDSWGWFWNDQW